MTEMRLALLFILLALTGAVAQESPAPVSTASPSPSPSVAPPRNVPLRFALPPLEGTISLGIYNDSGRLVRTLHREDSVSDFTAGHDALETSWDGTDDQGNPLPEGKYRARGYVVGDVKVEGVGYFFNDWVTDEDSPHIRRVENFALNSNGQLILGVAVAGGKEEVIPCDALTGATKTFPAQPSEVDLYQFVSPERLGVRVQDGQLALLTAESWQTVSWPILLKPVDAAIGKDGNVWVIDQIDRDSSELKEFSRNGEFLRNLHFKPTDPEPKIVRAAGSDDRVYLLEEKEGMQRLRGLVLIATTTDEARQPVSDWKINFEKKIVAHENFSLEQGRPVATSGRPQNSPQKVTQKLRSDPLRQDKPGKVELAIGIDEDGSFLKTADGLPLRTISDTPHLTRALLARPGDNALDVFQDDGAVVEEFRISNLAEMIAFDCGDFELK